MFRNVGEQQKSCERENGNYTELNQFQPEGCCRASIRSSDNEQIYTLTFNRQQTDTILAPGLETEGNQIDNGYVLQIG